MICKIDAEFLGTALVIVPKVYNHNSIKADKLSNLVMQYDTGAFMSVIDYSVVKRNGYKLIKPLSIYDTSRIKGIGGKPISVEYTIIPNIQIAGTDFGSLYACVVDFSIDSIVEPDVKAILGLNFIRGFKATTEFADAENVVITLQPKFNLEDVRMGEDLNPIFGSFHSSFWLLPPKDD